MQYSVVEQSALKCQVKDLYNNPPKILAKPEETI